MVLGFANHLNLNDSGCLLLMDDTFEFGCLRNLRIPMCFRWICKAAVALSGKSRDPKKALSILAFFRFSSCSGLLVFFWGLGVSGCEFLEKNIQLMQLCFYVFLGFCFARWCVRLYRIIFRVRPHI